MKQTAVVICPGRGSYNKTELAYLQRFHRDKQTFIAKIDQYRQQKNQPLISELDSAGQFSHRVHTRGDNASALIYTCAIADYLAIDRNKFDIVAVTGNSMGWYLALACTGVLDEHAAIDVVNTMGTLMHQQALGGQIIYPLVNDQWQYDSTLEHQLRQTIDDIKQQRAAEIYLSIRLGGMMVLAANEYALDLLLQKLPQRQGRFPLRLLHHGAYHSPLMQPIAEQAKSLLSADLFSLPTTTLIDGRGHIWQPYLTDIYDLYNYTFEQQVCDTYNFSASIEVAIKEFAPDKLILLGPGNSLGPPVAQELIRHKWLGLENKQQFSEQQQTHPFILSMDIDQQRSLVTGQR